MDYLALAILGIAAIFNTLMVVWQGWKIIDLEAKVNEAYVRSTLILKASQTLQEAPGAGEKIEDDR